MFRAEGGWDYWYIRRWFGLAHATATRHVKHIDPQYRRRLSACLPTRLVSPVQHVGGLQLLGRHRHELGAALALHAQNVLGDRNRIRWGQEEEEQVGINFEEAGGERMRSRWGKEEEQVGKGGGAGGEEDEEQVGRRRSRGGRRQAAGGMCWGVELMPPACPHHVWTCMPLTTARRGLDTSSPAPRLSHLSMQTF